MSALVVPGWLGMAGVMVVLWAVQLRTRDATSVDVAWAGGLGALAVAYAVLAQGDVARRIVVGGLAAAWALRLALHLLFDRVLKRQREDGRYRALRDHWGRRAPGYFFLFYQGQALIAVLFSLPILAAMQGGALDAWVVAGAGVWLIAVVGEAVADRQLARFRADPVNKGRTCQVGLWRYSRHPNYFFEWVHWWAYVLIGCGTAITWLGPIVMLIFLFRLTGIPYTEKQAIKSRGESYRRYQRTTSAFFPWFPREERG